MTSERMLTRYGSSCMLGQERKSQGRLSLGQLEKQPLSMFVCRIIIFTSKVERNLKLYTCALGGYLIQAVAIL